MSRADIIHRVGWQLVKALNKLQRPFGLIEMQFMIWNNQVHTWMENNHACCTRHGYRKDL